MSDLTRQEALVVIEAVRDAIAKHLEPRVAAIEKRERERERLQAVAKAIAALADRLEVLEGGTRRRGLH